MPEPLRGGKKEDVGALERARRRLYSQNTPKENVPQEIFSAPSTPELPKAWESDPLPPRPERPRHVHVAALFLGFAALFFVLATGVAAYLLYFGNNSVSAENVDLSIQGPGTIVGGDTVPFALSITNRNPTAIENASLVITFPAGTRSAEDVFKEYPRYTENVGTIRPGETITRSIKAIMFGSEGELLSVPTSLSFSAKNSSATFVKKSTYDLAISSSPLSLTIVAPTETVSGQSVTLTLAVRSNAKTQIGNIVLAAAYPYGFSLTSSSVPSQNGVFSLGTLRPGDTKNVTITGTLSGSDNEKRTFRFTTGTAKSATDPTLAISYVSQATEIALVMPFITTALALNGSRSEPFILAPGETSTVTISYTNTLPTAVTNAEIEVTLSGGAVDYKSVETQRGFYRSSDHTVVFSRDDDPALRSLEPGANGLGTFSFATLSGASLKDSSITFTISISGTRIGQANVPENVTASKVVTARVASATAFSARTTYATGPFKNSGPIPPTPNVATTYTVVWKIQNAANAIADATVGTVLPSYVTFTGAVSPSGALTYNPATRTITWSAGDMAANASLEGAFQLSLTPSTSQKGNPVALTGVASFTAFDRFAGVQVSKAADPATTETPGDPKYTPTKGSVQ